MPNPFRRAPSRRTRGRALVAGAGACSALLPVMLVVTVSLPTGVAAQQATSSRPALAPGTPVRVHVGGPPGDTLRDGSPLSLATTRRSGRLVRVDAESIVLARGADTVAIPRARVRAVEARIGEGSRRRVAARRAAIGAGIGAATGAVLAGVFYEPCDGEWLCYPRSQEMAITGVVWSVPGALLGGIAGMFGDTRRWEAVPLPPTTRVGLAATPRAVALRITF